MSYNDEDIMKIVPGGFSVVYNDDDRGLVVRGPKGKFRVYLELEAALKRLDTIKEFIINNESQTTFMDVLECQRALREKFRELEKAHKKVSILVLEKEDYPFFILHTYVE